MKESAYYALPIILYNTLNSDSEESNEDSYQDNTNIYNSIEEESNDPDSSGLYCYSNSSYSTSLCIFVNYESQQLFTMLGTTEILSFILMYNLEQKL
jgi:hypothetical protein